MPPLAGLFVLLASGAAVLAAVWLVLLVRLVRRPPRRALGAALAERIAADPGEAGHDFVEREVAATGGMWIVRGAATRGTVVLLHGWGQGRIDLVPAIADWRSRVARIVLFDLPGHGDAPGACGLGTGDADAVVAGLRALEERAAEAPEAEAASARPRILCGRSLGAVAAIAAARRAPELVDGVIACGVWDRAGTAIARRLRRMELPRAGLVGPATWILARLGAGMPTTGRLLAEAERPVLLVHGGDDRICPVEDARSMAAAAQRQGRPVDLVVVEGAGHRAGPFDGAAEAATVRFLAALR